MTDPSRRPDELLLDELAQQFERTRLLLTSGPVDAAERALERLGGESEIEARIALELANDVPLAHPGRFPAAHAVAVRALEMLEGEGARSPRVRGFGPLNGLFSEPVSFVAEFIVKSYAGSAARRIQSLYARREAQAAPGTPERRLLSRARMDMDRLVPGFAGGGFLAPLLLVGGAVIPPVAGLLQAVSPVELITGRALLVSLGALFVLFYVLAAVMLQGAAVARRRSRLIMSGPLVALWETVGRAGSPPRDEAQLFAAIAVVLAALLWVILPALVTTALLL